MVVQVARDAVVVCYPGQHHLVGAGLGSSWPQRQK
jgi:hypothetical protein